MSAAKAACVLLLLASGASLAGVYSLRRIPEELESDSNISAGRDLDLRHSWYGGDFDLSNANGSVRIRRSPFGHGAEVTDGGRRSGSARQQQQAQARYYDYHNRVDWNFWVDMI